MNKSDSKGISVDEKNFKTHKITHLRKWGFRVLAVLLVPALFFMMVEAGLRIFSYGYQTSFFSKIEGQRAYTGNPRFGWQFFPRALSRTPPMLYLPDEKSEGTYRIFVLGGSAALGEPEVSFGFSRILQVMLRERYPGVRFEVLNVAMTAINSHVILQIARDCDKHNPDLFIVYAGNNEVIGPFGAGTVLKGYSPNLFMIRASLWGKSTKTGQLLEDVAKRLRGDEEQAAEWGGMEMFLGQQVARDDPRLEKVYLHFRRNLEDICEITINSGAHIIISTVATNLKDSAPFASMHWPDLPASQLADWENAYGQGIKFEEENEYGLAEQQYLAAAKIDDSYADMHFRLARCYLALSNSYKAKQHYILARDLDTLRFRADTRINNIIREVASGKNARSIFLVDAERDFTGSDETQFGIPGDELFYEHVHMNFDGNYELSRSLFHKIADVLPESIRNRRGFDPEPPSKDRCVELLALTGWDRYRMASSIWDMTTKPPFTNQLDHAQWRERFFHKVRKLKKHTLPSELSAASGVYAQAIEANEDDLMLRNNLARLQLSCGDYASEERELEVLLRYLPNDINTHINVGAAMLAQGKMEEANEHFEQALRLTSRPIESYNNIGEAFAGQGKLTKAADYYRKALQIQPNHAQVLNNLGLVLTRQEKYEQAIVEFTKAARFMPSQPHVIQNLGISLLKLGKIDEARARFEEAVRIDPFYAQAHLHLAQMLARQGKIEGTTRHLAQAARIEPDNPDTLYRYADVLENQGRYKEALQQYHKVSQLIPNSPIAINRIAWILATSADPKLRDAPKAIRLAKLAFELTDYKSVEPLDTLAAAYAAAGQFQEAVQIASRVLEIVSASENAKLIKQIRGRLKLFRAGKPFLIDQPKTKNNKR